MAIWPWVFSLIMLLFGRHSPPRNWRPLGKLTFGTSHSIETVVEVVRLFGKESHKLGPSSKHQRPAPNFRVTKGNLRSDSRSDWVCRRASYYRFTVGTQSLVNEEDGNLEIIWVFIKWIVTVRIQPFCLPFQIFLYFSKFKNVWIW